MLITYEIYKHVNMTEVSECLQVLTVIILGFFVGQEGFKYSVVFLSMLKGRIHPTFSSSRSWLFMDCLFSVLLIHPEIPAPMPNYK
jgi:hypothetical protein